MWRHPIRWVPNPYRYGDTRAEAPRWERSSEFRAAPQLVIGERPVRILVSKTMESMLEDFVLIEFTRPGHIHLTFRVDITDRSVPISTNKVV
jgi:hypothetical protein